MGKTVQVKKHFAFVGGLNTEASPLTYPPNAWSDGDNVIPDIDGSLALRTAVDYEPSYALSSATMNSDTELYGAVQVAEWNNVGGDGNLHFLVEQRGITVRFYINAGATISSQLKSFTIDLSSYKASGNTETAGVAPISTANVNGNLIIVSRDTDPILVVYNASTDSITVSELSIQIRDFAGVDDSLDVDERPAALTAAHNYNLLNQGWNSTNITSYKTGAGVYPSNAQTWTAGKDSSDNFSQSLLDKQDFGTTPAAKGRYVLDLFNRDRSTASGVGGITTETESYRPTTCAFFAGRAWYAGMKSLSIGAWVLFSQVAEDTGKLGKCYQDADPTSEFVSDLVATDGGVIPIQDAGTVLKLMPFNDSMLVLCDNGVWQITAGAIDTGFSADSYSVRKISSYGAVAAKSVVFADSAVLYWGDDGIFAVTGNAQQMGVTSLSLTTIQSLYDDIPQPGKVNVSAAYRQDEHVVYWAYNDSDDQDNLQRRFKKNRLLCLNLSLKAFYTMTIEELASLTPYVTDIFVTKTRSAASLVFNVVDGSGNTVIDGSSNQVVATQQRTLGNVVKFLAVHPVNTTTYKTTFSEFNTNHNAPAKWREWYSNDSAGVNFDGFVIPGYDFGENQGADKFIQALYVLVYMRRTETAIDSDGNAVNPSSCLLQGRWDWADSDASNRWSASQEVYRHRRVWLAEAPGDTYDDGEPVVVTKNKVRGRGRSLQLKFANSADKDMQILGWAITYMGNSNV